jgi:hypothetical protein
MTCQHGGGLLTLLPRVGNLLLVVMLGVQRPTLSVKAATAPPDFQMKHHPDPI